MPLPHVCYLAERGRSALEGVGIYRENTKVWDRWGCGPLGRGMADPYKTV